MAQYEPIYMPRYLLELTEPYGTDVVTVAGLNVPKRFFYTVFIVSDEGKRVQFRRDEGIPTFFMRLGIEMTEEGKPFIADFGLSNKLRPITGWQLGFASKYRVELLTRSVRRVAQCWQYVKKGENYEWKQVAGMVRRKKVGDEVVQRWVESRKFLPKPKAFELDREVQRLLATKKLDKSFYRSFSKHYLDAQEAGLNPIQELSLIYMGTPDRTIQRWATTCRQFGYLPKIKAGRPSTRRNTKAQRKGKDGNTKKAKSR